MKTHYLSLSFYQRIDIVNSLTVESSGSVLGVNAVIITSNTLMRSFRLQHQIRMNLNVDRFPLCIYQNVNDVSSGSIIMAIIGGILEYKRSASGTFTHNSHTTTLSAKLTGSLL